MNGTVLAFTRQWLTAADVTGEHVIEAGALDVNGSVRPYVESLRPASYTGVDICPGPGVDRVMDAALVQWMGPAGVVISTEMLEHAADWRSALKGMICGLRHGGVLLLTTRAPGFPYHPHPGDYHRFTVPVMRQILTAAGLVVLACESDPAEPGVFVKARKPAPWAWPPAADDVWDAAEIAGPG